MQNHMKEGKKLDSFFFFFYLGITEAIYIIKNWKLGNYGSDFFFFLNNGKWPQEEIKAKKSKQRQWHILCVHQKHPDLLLRKGIWNVMPHGLSLPPAGTRMGTDHLPIKKFYAVRNKCLTGHSQMLIRVGTGPACQWSGTML